MDKKLKIILGQSLRETEPLFLAGAVLDTKFLNVLLGIYRISFTTLRDIYYLSLYEETGSSMLDFARKVIEHGITVEYIVKKGKEKMAKRFQDYLWVQVHDEMEFLKSIGKSLVDFSEDLKIGVEKAEKEYINLPSKIKGRKNWAGKDIDGMLKYLHDEKALGDFDFSRLGRAYIWGNRLNHPNPFAVRNYLDPREQKIADDYYLRQALFMAIIIHLRLTTRYIDEIRILSRQNLYQDLIDKVSKIYQDLNNLGSDKNIKYNN